MLSIMIVLIFLALNFDAHDQSSVKKTCMKDATSEKVTEWRWTLSCKFLL